MYVVAVTMGINFTLVERLFAKNICAGGSATGASDFYQNATISEY